MQRQTKMLNVFVEFRFQLFNMIVLFYFKLRVSAGMIENLKTRNFKLIPATFRSTEVFKNVGIFVSKEMLINTCVKMPIDFTNITSSTACTWKLITWFKRFSNKIFRTKHSANFERRENILFNGCFYDQVDGVAIWVPL